MRRIRTKVLAPSPVDLLDVKSGFSLYRQTHFYDRKHSDELNRAAREAMAARTLMPTGRMVRLQNQVRGF